MDRKNTKLAINIAKIYEKLVGSPFPGGPENAYIQRVRAGKYWASAGAWSWGLMPIDHKDAFGMAEIGSCYPAKDCIKMLKNGRLTFIKRDRGILGEFELMEASNGDDIVRCE